MHLLLEWFCYSHYHTLTRIIRTYVYVFGMFELTVRTHTSKWRSIICFFLHTWTVFACVCDHYSYGIHVHTHTQSDTRCNSHWVNRLDSLEIRVCVLCIQKIVLEPNARQVEKKAVFSLSLSHQFDSFVDLHWNWQFIIVVLRLNILCIPWKWRMEVQHWFICTFWKVKRSIAVCSS